jgi:hypothetical protein
LHFEFFADLVTAVGRRSGGTNGELLGGRFEGEEMAGDGFCGALLPCRGVGLGADAEKLAVLGESAVGSVEEEIVFVVAGISGFGPEFDKLAEEGFGVGEAEFDFDFLGHGLIVKEEEEGLRMTEKRKAYHRGHGELEARRSG